MRPTPSPDSAMHHPLRPTPAAQPRLLLASALLSALGALTACGGGGPTDPAATNSPPAAAASATGTGSGSGSGTGGDTSTAPTSALARALQTGDASGMATADLEAATRMALKAQNADHEAEHQALFGLSADGQATPDTVAAIDWDPTHDSSTFQVLDSGRNHVMLTGNWRYSDSTSGSGRVLAVTGTMPGSGARYAAFGGNPLAVRGNAAMDSFMRHTMDWLTGGKPPGGLHVVVAQMPGRSTYWFPHEGAVRNWLGARDPGMHINGVPAAEATDDSCDGPRLAACLQDADLLIIGRQQAAEGASGSDYPAPDDGAAIEAAVAQAQARGLPVLYLHHHRTANDLDTRLLARFGLALENNYWAQEGLKAYLPSDAPAQATDALALHDLLGRVALGQFTTTWSGCYNDLGRMLCDDAPGDAALMNEFLVPAQALRTRLRTLDARGLDLFAQEGYQAEKLSVLLADRYRQGVSYPMTKEGDRTAFFQAHFSDMGVYLNRSHQAVARNLGNFSGLFPADTPTVTRSVSAQARSSERVEYATGLYAMPGRTFTVTRTDSSTATVRVGLNMLRDSTHVYNTYDRPTMLASPHVDLAPGQTLTLTSPFGGPLYVFIEGQADRPTVGLQVAGTTPHPLLRDMRDSAQVEAFKNELAHTPTNWVVVTTDFLTLHATLPRFQETLTAHGGDMNLLADRIWTYLVKDTYELAGFHASDPSAFTLPTAVSDFCTGAGWDCSSARHQRERMQHVISDVYATCGSGCSGNPYDQNWALDPLGWGETHEIGHNLQRARLKIYGSLSSEVSNNIFPMHKQMMFNRAHPGSTPYTRGVNSPRQAFDMLKSASAQADPAAAVRAAIWTDTAYSANNALRMNFYRQLVEFARTHRAGFTDGWELYTLMYLLERNFTGAGADWAAQKDALGFGAYASYPDTMDGNDFMLIAISRIIGRDMRPVFDLWGVTHSANAGAQVAAYGLPAAERVFFPMKDLNQDAAGVAAPVAVGVNAVYPTLP